MNIYFVCIYMYICVYIYICVCLCVLYGRNVFTCVMFSREYFD